jgi:hypothetical protein
MIMGLYITTDLANQTFGFTRSHYDLMEMVFGF